MKADQSAPGRQRLRHGLVAAQMSVCLLLLVVAGLLLRSLTAAAALNPGFRIEGVQVATIDIGLGRATDAEGPEMTERIRTGLERIPGVSRVAVAAMIPLDGGGLGLGDLRPKGTTGPSTISADWNVISPEFLPALELPVVRGRNFTIDDRAAAPRVAVVNEHFASEVWPGQDPIGQQLEYGDFRAGKGETVHTLTIVGVARNAKYRWVGESPRSFIYVALSQEPWRRAKFFLASDRHVDGNADMAHAVRGILHAIDPDLPLVELTPMTNYAALGVLPQTIAASVAGALGSLALVLAAVGLYGVMSYAVTRRTREIGVRMALGADRRDVLRMVLRQGLRLTLVGGVVGLALGLAAAFGLASAGLLFGTTILDPLTFGATSALLVAVAIAATYFPARHAARIDPLTALRTE